MKIKITVEDTEITATLIDSKTTQDFIALLPLILTLEDYGNTEKSVICQNDEALNVSGPVSATIELIE